MSIRVMTKVFSHSEAKLAGRLVLLALADAASDDGIAWLGQDAIAAKAKVAVATVRSCLRELEASGEVQTRKAKVGRSRINVHRVMMPGIVAPDYTRLPFKLDSPFDFDDRGILAVVENDDDRGITPSTTAGLRTKIAGSPLVVEPSVTREANASHGGVLFSPPPLEKIEGRNVGFDELAAACGIQPSDPNRAGEIAAALNGGRAVKVGIRALVWNELVAQHFDGDGAAALVAVEAEPTRFENALAAMIQRRASQYRSLMSGALITPTALAKWWLTLEGLAAERPAGLSAEEMEAQGG